MPFAGLYGKSVFCPKITSLQMFSGTTIVGPRIYIQFQSTPSLVRRLLTAAAAAFTLAQSPGKVVDKGEM